MATPIAVMRRPSLGKIFCLTLAGTLKVVMTISGLQDGRSCNVFQYSATHGRAAISSRPGLIQFPRANAAVKRTSANVYCLPQTKGPPLLSNCAEMASRHKEKEARPRWKPLGGPNMSAMRFLFCAILRSTTSARSGCTIFILASLGMVPPITRVPTILNRKFQSAAYPMVMPSTSNSDAALMQDSISNFVTGSGGVSPMPVSNVASMYRIISSDSGTATPLCTKVGTHAPGEIFMYQSCSCSNLPCMSTSLDLHSTPFSSNAKRTIDE
mmetsp:Transcript_107750/g.303583  ORF Transcript_107750/g.303583 Transcript_107750/m.303583 type:complete len:269 (-) Transcript_107750:196-1002(-)